MKPLLQSQSYVPDVVCFVAPDWKKYAIGQDRIIASGWKAGTVIQAACDYVGSNGFGTVVIKDRMVIEKQPLTIPERVRVHCSGSGVLVNKLADTTVPFIQFEPEATAGWLRVNANSRGGIRFGEPHQQANTFTDRIYLFGVGPDATGIETNGYQVTGNWWHVQGDGSTACTGFDFRGTSDLFLNSAIAVGTHNAVVFDENEHVFIPVLDCDSGNGTAITIQKVHDMRLGCSVWCNASAKPDLEWDTAVDIQGKCHTIRLDANIMRPGRVGMRVSNIAASRIDATITNKTAYPAAPDPMGIDFIRKENVAESVAIDVVSDM